MSLQFFRDIEKVELGACKAVDGKLSCAYVHAIKQIELAEAQWVRGSDQSLYQRVRLLTTSNGGERTELVLFGTNDKPIALLNFDRLEELEKPAPKDTGRVVSKGVEQAEAEAQKQEAS